MPLTVERRSRECQSVALQARVEYGVAAGVRVEPVTVDEELHAAGEGDFVLPVRRGLVSEVKSVEVGI